MWLHIYLCIGVSFAPVFERVMSIYWWWPSMFLLWLHQINYFQQLFMCKVRITTWITHICLYHASVLYSVVVTTGGIPFLSVDPMWQFNHKVTPYTYWWLQKNMTPCVLGEAGLVWWLHVVHLVLCAAVWAVTVMLCRLSAWRRGRNRRSGRGGSCSDRITSGQAWIRFTWVSLLSPRGIVLLCVVSCSAVNCSRRCSIIWHHLQPFTKEAPDVWSCADL